MHHKEMGSNLITAHDVKHVLYTYFPENPRPWRGRGILHARSSCIPINVGSNLPTLLNNTWLVCVRATSSGRKPRGKLWFSVSTGPNSGEVCGSSSSLRSPCNTRDAYCTHCARISASTSLSGGMLLLCNNVTIVKFNTLTHILQILQKITVFNRFLHYRKQYIQLSVNNTYLLSCKIISV
jgi:hypothetical protein